MLAYRAIELQFRTVNMCVKISFIICICSLAFNFAQAKPKLTLYYETLCPYSKEFIKEQLAPNYAELGSEFTVELVPYGRTEHTNSSGKWETICPHGTKECRANRIQSCVLGADNPNATAVNFVLCIMSSGSPEKRRENKKCASENKLSWDDIKTCVDGSKGDEMVSHFENRTNSLSFRLWYVPHIIFDDIDDRDVEQDARNDLRKVICKKLQYKPIKCASIMTVPNVLPD